MYGVREALERINITVGSGRDVIEAFDLMSERFKEGFKLVDTKTSDDGLIYVLERSLGLPKVYYIRQKG